MAETIEGGDGVDRGGVGWIGLVVGSSEFARKKRTLLADSLLPIPFWAEAVNTSCYVQNRVLVTKPHNKTPYELLHGRLPSIGFMRPFGCPITILNILDPLGKFQGKVDKGFLVGYSVCSKAFRVFNSRTLIVQETLHVNFMENKPNVASSGPAWLFDIDSLSQTMNYHPVLAENQSNPTADAHTGGNEHNDDIQKSVSPDIHSSSCGDQAKEQGDKAMNKDKGKSPVVTITGFRDLNKEFIECINNSSNGVSAAGPLVSVAGLEFTNSTNDFTTTGPLVSAAELNFTNSTNDFSAADDVGAEADTNNMESVISTRSMARGVRDQGGISQMFNEDFHTCICGNDDDVVGEGGVVEMVWRWQQDDEGVDGWWLYRDCGGSRGGMAINHG
nr:retrovirus-related Pol polyprotein from transposon TNT 1-94 [Tanacetum cinerariifolium]